MMKKYTLLGLLVACAFLVACTEDYGQTAQKIRQKMTVRVLTEADPDSDVPTDFTVLCIDGIKYLQTKQGGITVKYEANENADASPEECELK